MLVVNLWEWFGLGCQTGERESVLRVSWVRGEGRADQVGYMTSFVKQVLPGV
jgi:hypothetical protein